MSRCIAQTSKSRQCKQRVIEGSEYCVRHKELHVDLVAEMEVVEEANRVREEKLKQKIDKLEKLLVRANEKAAAVVLTWLRSGGGGAEKFQTIGSNYF